MKYLLWGLMLGCMVYACTPPAATTTSMQKIQGNTMGTTWHITYEGPDQNPVKKEEVDSVLAMINQSASTYIPTSLISRLNKGETIDVEAENAHEIEFFKFNVSIAEQVWNWSDGYFDPTVMDLVNYWGFGYEGHRPVELVDSVKVDSLLQFVGYGDLLDQLEGATWKLPHGYQLDFSAVAKGAACDWLGDYFKERGIENYLIEIGGEMLLHGPGRAGEGWVIGVSKPQVNAPAQELIEELVIKDQAVATSGNYRNYYESNGQLFTHTINPKTGYSEQSNVLSATVITDGCGLADALATAVMAMGSDKGKAMLDQIPEVEAYLIYNNGSDSMLIYETSGMKSLKYKNNNDEF